MSVYPCYLVRWLSTFVAFIVLSLSGGLQAEERPNIVLIVADDMGPMLGCYGDKVAKTPHIDALAAEGVRFTQAFCTTASCSPSRSVILTGMHNHSNGQYGLAHAEHHFVSKEKLKPLPVSLTEAGYRTARIGKFHVIPEETYKFDEVIKNPGTNPVKMAEDCEKWLAGVKEAPFFLYYCTIDPHRSGKGGGKVEGVGDVDPFGNFRPNPGCEKVVFDPAKVPVPSWLPDMAPVRAELAEYYQSINRVDQGIGRLMKALETTGHAQKTIVIVTSDNGPPFPGAKTGLYEPGMRLPFVMKVPGFQKKGHVNHSMISWVDLTPTLLDFAGAKVPQGVQGRSFKGILDAETAPGWNSVFGSHSFHEVTMYYPMRVLREAQYKLIHNLASPLEYPFASDLWASATWQDTLTRKLEYYGQRRTQDFLHRQEWELYDLTADPAEIRNLATQPEHAERLKKMQAQLREFQASTGDPWKIKEMHE